MLIVPMVFCSLVVRRAPSIGDLRKLGGSGGEDRLFIFLADYRYSNYSRHHLRDYNSTPAGGYVLKEVGTYESEAMPKVADVILNMVPTNPN